MGLFNTLSLSVAAAVLCTAAVADDFGDPVAGEAVYKQCKRCHQVGEGAKHRIGPHLNGILGRQAD